MIVDKLENCSLYEEVHKDFAKVFQVLKTFAADTKTEKIVLEEGNVWILPPSVVDVSESTKPLEAHRKFIDIHYIVAGAEKFGYASLDGLKTIKEYDDNDDYELLDGDHDFITIKTGYFCIVFPQDAHVPACAKSENSELVRVVAKIRC